MKILVIGGNGFIGSHIVKKLQNEKFHVSVFDRSPNKFMAELEGVNYIYGDFSDIELIKKSLEGVDVLYHLLSTTVPATANDNPLFDVESNLVGTIKLLELLKGSSVKRIIFASSGGTVYGAPEYIPIEENHPLHPIGSYGITKVAIESYIQLYAKKLNISYLIVRPSNPYGPRQSYNGVQGVISTFLYKAIKGETLTVWGDGESIRDYIYITDVADFFVKAGLSEKQGIFNIGSGQGYSINEVIKVIEHVVCTTVRVNHINPNTFSVKEVVLNIGYANKIFDWEPSTSFVDGIKLHYTWIKKEIYNGLKNQDNNLL